MAYVRWSGTAGPHPYVSDVYVFDHVDGGVECCGCLLHDGDSHRLPDGPAMVGHVAGHIAAGHQVPGFVMPSLLGQSPRHSDATLTELLDLLGPDGRIATVDRDVPARYRIDLNSQRGG